MLPVAFRRVSQIINWFLLGDLSALKTKSILLHQIVSEQEEFSCKYFAKLQIQS